MNISILGAGAWGTALATVFAHNGHAVLLWAREQEVVDDINENHRNSHYLPGHVLNHAIKATMHLEQAVGNAQWICEAVPVAYLRETVQKASVYAVQDQVWVVTSKGIEQHTLLLPTQVIDDTFKHTVEKLVLAGPSFAHGVAKHDVTGVVIAGEDMERAKQLQALCATSYFKPFISCDPIGVQVGAALKNLMGIAFGMLDGAHAGENTKAYLFTRALAETSKLGVAIGAHKETFYGLSGVGDAMLSAMSKQSRNTDLGYRLGQGNKLEDILKEYNSVPEGINTVQAVYQLIKEQHIDLSLCTGVYQVLFEHKPIDCFMEELAGLSLTTD